MLLESHESYTQTGFEWVHRLKFWPITSSLTDFNRNYTLREWLNQFRWTFNVKDRRKTYQDAINEIRSAIAILDEAPPNTYGIDDSYLNIPNISIHDLASSIIHDMGLDVKVYPDILEYIEERKEYINDQSTLQDKKNTIHELSLAIQAEEFKLQRFERYNQILAKVVQQIPRLSVQKETTSLSLVNLEQFMYNWETGEVPGWGVNPSEVDTCYFAWFHGKWIEYIP